MQIVFDMPHVFRPGANHVENALALQALLNCLVALDSAYLQENPTPSLYGSGVRYGRTKEWDTIPAVIKRGYGDCKSLTAWLVAEKRRQGIECRPCFRWLNRPDGSGAIDFHILVEYPGAKYEDPSRVLGMGANEVGPIISNPLRLLGLGR